ncbi:MAG: carboxypeptidase-like regulatory domain-containing protein [Bacteroidales bacterium]|nr:carboxypeptidase-like regulatory domain-containing protein [Bacteroidales bacterium]
MKYNFLKISIFILLSLIFLDSNLSFAQKTIVKGVVTDASSNEALPFVNIAFNNINEGTITEMDGTFTVETSKAVDSISISYIGYTTQVVKVKRGTIQNLNINLVPSDLTLSEIVIYAGENPANQIIRNIIDNKKQNNPDKINYFGCEVYNKLQIDLNNITDKFKNRKVFKNFQFVFELQDSSEIMGKTYLPIFLSENYSKYYFQKKPEKKKEIIIANKISGVENKSFTEFTGQMYIDMNIYDNYINVFGKQFVSPIGNTGLKVYKYFLEDSTFIEGKWCYNITFKPRRKQERTFHGNFWVNDSTWAIKKITAQISEDANINYVKDLILEQEFSLFGDTIWFKTEDKLFADINLADKAQGFFGRKQTSYKNLNLNPPSDENFFSSTQVEEAIIVDSVEANNHEYWNSVRPSTLSSEEESIYQMVDSVKNVPIFKTFTDVIYMLAYGYYLYKDFEFGPYFKTYSFNPIEGNRFRFGGRTSNEFSTRLMLYGHIAYGTKDEEFKYGLGALYIFKKLPRFSVDMYYENDLSLLGQSVNAFSEDNFLASILSIRPNDNLLYLEQYKLDIEKEWFQGLSNNFKLFYANILPSYKIQFQNIETNESYDKLVATEISLKTRFAYNEKVLRGEFTRVSLGSIYPIVDLELTKGLKNILNSSNFDYLRTRLTINHLFDIKPIGYLKYELSVGKIWGKVPFPFLVLHEGNETYAMDNRAFNLMLYYEFASDFYYSVYLEHHFQGFFLNKIPLLRKLKWREIVYAKFLNGSISDENKNVWVFPQSLTELPEPYVEAGVGIENIFKIIRIDAMWRLTNRNKAEIKQFGIRAKLQLIF